MGRIFALIVCAGCSLGGLLLWMPHPAHSAGRPGTACDAVCATQRAEELLARMAPDADWSSMVADLHDPIATRQRWDVRATDGRGSCSAETTWDAPTGALLYAAFRPTGLPRGASSRPPDATAIGNAARRWLTALGMLDPRGARAPSRPPEASRRGTWLVLFRCDDRTVYAVLDRDGQPLHAMDARLFEPVPRWLLCGPERDAGRRGSRPPGL